MEVNQTWTPLTLVKWISQYLSKKELPSPHRLEAELMVAHVLGIKRLDIYLQYDKPCSAEELATLKSILKRRVQREPLAYILGHCEFWTLTLDVGAGVLIPRQDTEVLIETTLSYLQKEPQEKKKYLLELGTGTAAIPLALSAESQNLRIFSIEKSKVALSYARKNLARYQSAANHSNNKIFLIHGNAFEAIKEEKKFDIIVTNPPYIPASDINTLQAEVRDWEPKEALDGGERGMDFYLYLRQVTPKLLNPNGLLIVEHGFDQAELLTRSFLEEDRLQLVEQIKDLAQNDRVLVFKLKSS